jgi:hypothetical protein
MNVFMKIMSSPADHSTPEFMLAIEEQLSEDLGLSINYDLIREKRLAELIKQSLDKGKVQKQAGPQLIDSLYFTEPDEEGIVHAHPTAKTYDLLNDIAKAGRSELETELRKRGIDLSKLSEDEPAAA